MALEQQEGQQTSTPPPTWVSGDSCLDFHWEVLSAIKSLVTDNNSTTHGWLKDCVDDILNPKASTLRTCGNTRELRLLKNFTDGDDLSLISYLKI